MTKKDYELIASAIKPVLATTQDFQFFNGDERGAIGRTINDIVGRLCRNFEIDNSRFDRVKFLEAVGLGGDEYRFLR